MTKHAKRSHQELFAAAANNSPEISAIYLVMVEMSSPNFLGDAVARAKVKIFKPKFLLRCATHSLVKKLISDSQVKAVHHTPSQCEFLLA